MELVRSVVALGAVLSCAFVANDAPACSCVGVRVTLLAPDRVDDAPLNTRVRVDVPSSVTKVVLRVHGGDEVATTTKTIPSGNLSTLDIAPARPLAAHTQYEVVYVDMSRRPSVTVFGTFKTGDASDTTAPKLDAAGAATAYRNPNADSGMCQTTGPWVKLVGLAASDPGRPNAQLALAVWLGDAGGTIDDTKPPAIIESLRGAEMTVGRSSVCSMRDVSFPDKGQRWLGLAVVDEAGNRSAVRRVRVDLSSAASP